MRPPDPLICRVVTDGRRGIENQALGLAEAVGRLTPLSIETLVVERPGWLGGPPASAADPAPLQAMDLWIGCGRAAVAVASVHRRLRPDAAFVYVQDPKRRYDSFDLIVAPEHDAVARANVFPTLGSPNRITETLLAEAKAAFAALDALPRPRAAVLLGGKSKRHRFSPAVAETLLAQLSALARDGRGLMITASRRTPAGVVSQLRDAFGDKPNVRLWTGEEDGPNPFFGFLAQADVAIVTQDSTNMITEAASAGLPVLLARLDGSDGKFADLYDALVARGAARWFTGALEAWSPPPLRETERAAQAVLSVLRRRG